MSTGKVCQAGVGIRSAPPRPRMRHPRPLGRCRWMRYWTARPERKMSRMVSFFRLGTSASSPSSSSNRPFAWWEDAVAPSLADVEGEARPRVDQTVYVPPELRPHLVGERFHAHPPASGVPSQPASRTRSMTHSKASQNLLQAIGISRDGGEGHARGRRSRSCSPQLCAGHLPESRDQLAARFEVSEHGTSFHLSGLHPDLCPP